MNVSREFFIPAMIGAMLSALCAVLFSIYADFLPILQSITIAIYIKIIGLLLLILIFLIVAVVRLYLKAKVYRTLALEGKKFGFKWSARLTYEDRKRDVKIEIQWLCPKHKLFLHTKPAEIPEKAYSKFWCTKCKTIQEMKSDKALVYVEEVNRVVEREIRRRLRF